MIQNIVLASDSERRKHILRSLGLDFICLPAGIDETIGENLSPANAVEGLAREKARKCAARLCAREREHTLIIAADTIVLRAGETLGKPTDARQAKQMLLALSGGTHDVYTGYSVLVGEKQAASHERTEVTFRTLSEEEIDAYLVTGEPFDKAGAYGIQGKGALFVSRIKGDYFNVVGLPVCALFELIKNEFGLRLDALSGRFGLQTDQGGDTEQRSKGIKNEVDRTK